MQSNQIRATGGNEKLTEIRVFLCAFAMHV